jgi:hypothetical protein
MLLRTCWLGTQRPCPCERGTPPYSEEPVDNIEPPDLDVPEEPYDAWRFIPAMLPAKFCMFSPL